MANPPRNRKRVRALRRAPDGSAFQKCNDCGASVPVVLVDMHECQAKKDVKKFNFKGKCDERPAVKKKKICEEPKLISEEPRSAFQFFVESYAKTCNGGDMIETNRKAFEKWKTMSFQEQWPYIHRAEKVEKAYLKVVREEIEQLSQEGDDEADSAMVWKYDQLHYEEYEDSEDDDNSEDSGSHANYSSEKPLAENNYSKERHERLWQAIRNNDWKTACAIQGFPWHSDF